MSTAAVLGKLTPVYLSVAKFLECFTKFGAPFIKLGEKEAEKKENADVSGELKATELLTTLLAETLWETLVGFESEARGEQEWKGDGEWAEKKRLEACTHIHALPMDVHMKKEG